jgi:undecaprenyl-diphosphatase
MVLPTLARSRLPLLHPLPTLLWLLGWLVLAAMAALAAAFDYFPADLWLAHRLQDIDTPAFVRSLDWAEDLADTPWVIIVWLLGIGVLFLAARRWEAFLLLAIMIGRPINAGLKELVSRPRPSPELVRATDNPSDFAFTSGHVVGAVLLYGFLFYLAAALIPNPFLRLIAQAACLYIIAFTAIERIYVGAHWPSDTLGAFLLGLLILAAFIWAHRRLRVSQPSTELRMPP